MFSRHICFPQWPASEAGHTRQYHFQYTQHPYVQHSVHPILTYPKPTTHFIHATLYTTHSYSNTIAHHFNAPQPNICNQHIVDPELTHKNLQHSLYTQHYTQHIHTAIRYSTSLLRILTEHMITHCTLNPSQANPC